MIESVKNYQKNLSPEKEAQRQELRRLAFQRSKEQKQKKLFYLLNIYDKNKFEANKLLAEALRNGEIKKPDNCQICNEIKPLDGHHADYDRPLEVVWVCRKCHMQIHKKLRQGSKC